MTKLITHDLQVGSEGRVVGLELRSAALDLARSAMAAMLEHPECALRPFLS